MTSICGHFQLDGALLPPKPLDAMLAASVGYLHDVAGTWRDGPVALGCQLRWTTPASKLERLPLYDEQLELAIVADARIDNRVELIDILRIPRELGAAMADGQIILHAYARWGVDCTPYLLGDFAFAIWDRGRQQLFAARDFMGIRPFYYHAGASRFLFATDMAQLLAAEIPLDLDLPYLSAHFRNGHNYPHRTRTFYATMRKLGRAQVMTVSVQGEMKTWTYWEPTQLPEVRYADDDEYACHLRHLLGRAVADRVQSDYPVGVHLSGGLDCSSVAVLAQRRLRAEGQSATGFSWSPPPADDETLDDERRLVNLVSDAEEIPVHYASVLPGQSLAARLRHPVRHRDAFFVHELSVRATAARLGIRTMLSGWGGDELISFNGRGRFADLLRRGRVRHLWRELSLRAQIHGGVVWKEAIARGLFPLMPEPLLRRVYPAAVLDRWVVGPLPELPFTSDFMAELQRAKPLPRPPGRERPGVRRTQLDLLAREHMTHRIEGWAAAGGRTSITYAYPLLDRRVVEFALGLPPQMFFQHGWKRYLFRHAMAGILPDAVRWNKSKREPALVALWRQNRDEEFESVVTVVNRVLTAAATRLLDLDRVQALALALTVADSDRVSDLAGVLTAEMLVNPHYEDLIEQLLCVDACAV